MHASAAAGMFQEAIRRATPDTAKAPILTTYAEMIDSAPEDLLLQSGGWDTLVCFSRARARICVHARSYCTLCVQTSVCVESAW